MQRQQPTKQPEQTCATTVASTLLLFLSQRRCSQQPASLPPCFGNLVETFSLYSRSNRLQPRKCNYQRTVTRKRQKHREGKVTATCCNKNKRKCKRLFTTTISLASRCNAVYCNSNSNGNGGNGAAKVRRRRRTQWQQQS